MNIILDMDEYAADNFLLALLMHSIQDCVDEDYQTAGKSFGRCDAFFRGLRYEMSRCFHENRGLFLLTVTGCPPDS